MSRRRALGSVEDVGDGKKRVRVSAGRDPITGRRRRPSETVKGDARAVESTIAVIAAVTGKVRTSDLTVEQLSARFLRTVEPPEVRQRTYEYYEDTIRLYIVPIIGQVKLTELDAFACELWKSKVAKIQKRQSAKKKKAKVPPEYLSPETRRHAFRVLYTMLEKAAVVWHLIPFNPLDGVAPPKVPKRRPNTLDVDEYNAYLDAFRGHLIEPIVLVAMDAALRRSELCALGWQHLDLRKTVTMTKNGPVTTYRGSVDVLKGLHQRHGRVWEEDPKTDESAGRISLAPTTVIRLLEVRGDLRFGPLVMEDGAAIKPDRLSLLYSRHVKASELRRIPLKNLRHTVLTLMLKNGATIWDTSKRGRHTEIRTTTDFYIDQEQAMNEEVAETVGSLRKLPEVRPTSAQQAVSGPLRP